MWLNILADLKIKIRNNPLLYSCASSARSLCHHYIKAYIDGNSCKQILNYRRCVDSAKKRLPVSKGNPVLLTIEPVNYCNLKCPICETGTGTLGREKRTMSFEEFKYILDQFDDNLNQLYFYFMGEPFLNREGYQMVRYAANRGIRVTTCANAGFIDPQQLVDSGIAEVNFQISGMTQAIHEIYRINSNLKRVMESIEETIRIRDLLDSRNRDMKVVVGFILMKHNEHQLIDFLKFCEQTKVDGYNIIGTTARTAKQAREYMPSDPQYHRFILEEAIRNDRLVPIRRPDNYCGWIYSTATIMVNGDVVPCCYDPMGKYVVGNVFKNNFYEIWNNDKYKAIRKMVSSNSNEFDLCKTCIGEGVPAINRR